MKVTLDLGQEAIQALLSKAASKNPDLLDRNVTTSKTKALCAEMIRDEVQDVSMCWMDDIDDAEVEEINEWAVAQIRRSPASQVTVDRPRRYLRSATGVLHLRSASGVIEEDGLSSSRARCGWESDRDAIAEAVSADDRVCRRCLVIEP